MRFPILKCIVLLSAILLQSCANNSQMNVEQLSPAQQKLVQLLRNKNISEADRTAAMEQLIQTGLTSSQILAAMQAQALLSNLGTFTISNCTVV